MVYTSLAAVLLALLLVGLMMLSANAPAKPVPLPPAAQLQQRHPDWPIHYCQEIVDHVVSTGMTKEMVIVALGNPDRELASSGDEILSYPYIGTGNGKRKIVLLENGVVTKAVLINIHDTDLNNIVDSSEDMILLFYGPPTSVFEASSGNTWTYSGYYSNTVDLHFTRTGKVSSWDRYEGGLLNKLRNSTH